MTLTAATSAQGSATITSFGVHGARIRTFVGSASSASTAWPTNNQAYAIPFYVATTITVVKMFWMSGVTPGTTNFDLGIYRDDFSLITSLGATATVNTTRVIEPSTGGDITDTTLPRGRYYMAMSAASTGTTIYTIAPANHMPRALGVKTMATAHPLPTTFVPASMSTSTFFPLIGLAFITNLI